MTERSILVTYRKRPLDPVTLEQLARLIERRLTNVEADVRERLETVESRLTALKEHRNE